MSKDLKIAEQLIRFYIQHKYSTIKDKYIARGYAKEDLTQVKLQFGWQIMKRAARHNGCTSITAFKVLCYKFKELDL